MLYRGSEVSVCAGLYEELISTEGITMSSWLYTTVVRLMVINVKLLYITIFLMPGPFKLSGLLS